MALEAVKVKVGEREFTVHALKASQQHLYFNGVAACRDLYAKLSQVVAEPNGHGPVRFSPADFQEPGELITAMTGLTAPELAELDMSEWWGLLNGMLELDKDFLARARPSSRPPTS